MLISILNVTTFLFEVPCSVPFPETTILLVLFDFYCQRLSGLDIVHIYCVGGLENSLVGKVEMQILYAEEVGQAYTACLLCHSKDKHS
jgi:hypothetical protein